MIKIETFEEYKNLVNKVRLTYKTLYSNNYFLAEDIRRYISMGRIYYEVVNSGIILFFDEEYYYRACLCVDSKQPFVIPALDKMIVMRNVYRAERKETGMEEIENCLKNIGFTKEGTTVQLRGSVQEMFSKCCMHEKIVKRMEGKGYRCLVAEGEYIERVEEFLKKTHIIKEYHIDFLTKDEKNRGRYLYIENGNGEMCAASAFGIDKGVGHGIGVAVLEQYKLHGLASALGYYFTKWMKENNVEHVQAWALVNNENSLRFHASRGYEITNRYADEWIRR